MILRKWSDVAGLGVGACLVLGSLYNPNDSSQIQAVYAAGLVGGLGPIDCVLHPWKNCAVDYCSGPPGSGLKPLPPGAPCMVCRVASPAQVCAGLDTDGIACVVTPMATCTGQVDDGTCSLGLCVTTGPPRPNCPYAMTRCRN